MYPRKEKSRHSKDNIIVKFCIVGIIIISKNVDADSVEEEDVMMMMMIMITIIIIIIWILI